MARASRHNKGVCSPALALLPCVRLVIVNAEIFLIESKSGRTSTGLSRKRWAYQRETVEYLFSQSQWAAGVLIVVPFGAMR